MLAVAICAYIALWGVRASLFVGEVAPIASSTISAGETVSSTASSSPTSGTLSYQAALKKYVNRYAQFDPACKMTPGSIVVKNGASFMLDNRSGKALTIHLDDVAYALKAYGFRIVSLSRRTLPATVRVDCGNGKNNGTVILN